MYTYDITYMLYGPKLMLNVMTTAMLLLKSWKRLTRPVTVPADILRISPKWLRTSKRVVSFMCQHVLTIAAWWAKNAQYFKSLSVSAFQDFNHPAIYLDTRHLPHVSGALDVTVLYTYSRQMKRVHEKMCSVYEIVIVCPPRYPSGFVTISDLFVKERLSLWFITK